MVADRRERGGAGQLPGPGSSAEIDGLLALSGGSAGAIPSYGQSWGAWAALDQAALHRAGPVGHASDPVHREGPVWFLGCYETPDLHPGEAAGQPNPAEE